MSYDYNSNNNGNNNSASKKRPLEGAPDGQPAAKKNRGRWSKRDNDIQEVVEKIIRREVSPLEFEKQLLCGDTPEKNCNLLLRILENSKHEKVRNFFFNTLNLPINPSDQNSSLSLETGLYTFVRKNNAFFPLDAMPALGQAINNWENKLINSYFVVDYSLIKCLKKFGSAETKEKIRFLEKMRSLALLIPQLTTQNSSTLRNLSCNEIRNLSSQVILPALSSGNFSAVTFSDLFTLTWRPEFWRTIFVEKENNFTPSAEVVAKNYGHHLRNNPIELRPLQDFFQMCIAKELNFSGQCKLLKAMGMPLKYKKKWKDLKCSTPTPSSEAEKIRLFNEYIDWNGFPYFRLNTASQTILPFFAKDSPQQQPEGAPSTEQLDKFFSKYTFLLKNLVKPEEYGIDEELQKTRNPKLAARTFNEVNNLILSIPAPSLEAAAKIFKAAYHLMPLCEESKIPLDELLTECRSLNNGSASPLLIPVLTKITRLLPLGLAKENCRNFLQIIAQDYPEIARNGRLQRIKAMNDAHNFTPSLIEEWINLNPEEEEWVNFLLDDKKALRRGGGGISTKNTLR